MKHLGEFIVQDGYDEENVIERISSRAIIFNENNQILFIYSKFYDDVTFPGGGVDEGETLISALKRECLEEVGAILDEITPFYKITEKRKSFNNNPNTFTSYYYICTCSEFTSNSLLDYEIKLGYSPVWLSIDEAIFLNFKTMKKLLESNKNTSVLEREIRILNKLKKSI